VAFFNVICSVILQIQAVNEMNDSHSNVTGMQERTLVFIVTIIVHELKQMYTASQVS
jgi:hypothetical protein